MAGLIGLSEIAVEGCAEDTPTRTRDLRDVTLDDLRGFDAVVHLANLSNDPLGTLDPALTYEINVDATVRLARLARAAGVRPVPELVVLQRLWRGGGTVG